MTIDGNWYMAECTSTKEPVPYMDGETFYLPVNIEFSEETQMYSYQEYRFTMPIDYEVPAEVSDALANELDIYSKQFGKRILSLENGQAEANKKASETDMAILGLMDTILSMQSTKQ